MTETLLAQEPRIGCVLIGRNEGTRLKHAIASLPASLRPFTVYVDSGSTDGSQALARREGLHVVELDLEMPFTAARARNAGAVALQERQPNLKYIQFMDGDCILAENWLDSATSFLDKHPDVALVCGRRRERFPDQSIYNRLCDIEWNTPVGRTNACGGDFLIRGEVFKMVGGFSPELIAGEEPDLCFRIRKLGHQIYRLDCAMTLHDANIHSFAQWFKRAKRTGYAYAEAVYRHRHQPDGYWRRELGRTIVWGMFLPLFTALTSWLVHPIYISILSFYPLQFIRIMLRSNQQDHRWLYSSFMMLSKFPEAIGVLAYLQRLIFSTPAQLIEYK